MTNSEAIRIINQYDCNFYWTDGEKIPTEDLIEAFELAVKALDATEPRVLTLEEVRDEYEVVWLETKYLQPTVCLVDNGESDADWICFAFGVDDSYPMSWHLCGKSWRCWSAKPTDEQREAVPWTE